MGIDEILGEKRDEILRIASIHGAYNVRVFGSVARGDAGPNSDIDLLVNLQPDRSLLDHVGLIQDLEAMMGRKIDVVIEEALHWYIRERVIREAIKL
jgi:predicted nucleotidyltransferase